MFQVEGFHFGHNEEISVSHHDRIAQNQRNLCERVMDHDTLQSPIFGYL